MSRRSFDNLFNHTPHGPETLLRLNERAIHWPSDTFQYFIIKIKAKFTSSVRKNVVKLSLRESPQEEAGGYCRKSDFILKTLSGEYFVRKSFFMARHVLLTSSFFCMRRRRRIMGDEENKNPRRRWTNRSFGEKCKFLDHQEISTGWSAECPTATRFYVISSKDMQINVLINNRLYRWLATGW